ncbi:MAG TPA: ATP-binding protein [Gemmatimonadaceae bacterium]|nr:ATP-binding protein [Gemmatimonadaceae bacterium]
MTRTPGPFSGPPLPAATIGLGAGAFLLALVALLAPADAARSGGVALFDGAIVLAAAVFTATVSTRAGRRARGTRRILFAGITAAAAIVALGHVVWIVRILAGVAHPPFPSLHELSVLGAQLALFVAIAVALLRHRSIITVETMVDGLLLIVAAAMVTVELDVFPAAMAASVRLSPDLAIGWQLVTAASLVALAILLAWRGELLGPRTATGLAVGMVCLALGSAWTVREGLAGGGSATGAVDALLLLAFTGCVSALGVPGSALDARLSAERPRVASDAAMIRTSAIVAAILIAAGSALVLGFRSGGSRDLAVVLAVFGLLLAVRTGYALWMQQRTTIALEHTVVAEREVTSTLEHRVAERTRELGEAQRVLQRMWILAQQSARELEADRLLHRYLEAVLDVLRADAAVVEVATESGQVAIAANVHAALAPTVMPLERSAAVEMMRGGSVRCVDDVRAPGSPPLLEAAWLDGGAESAAIIPLQRRGTRIGAVVVLGRTPRRFRPAELSHVEAMTDLLSVALANADLVETLRQTEWRFRTLFRAAPDAVMTVLESGRVREANDAVTDVLGCPPIQVIGRSLEEFVIPEEAERLRYELLQALDGEPCRTELRFRSGSGTRIVSLAARRLPEADPPTVLVVGRDVTGDHEMRVRLAQTERLAAVGELVAGVAHEVNNPLATISAFAQLLMRDETLTEQHRESIDVIQSETTRAGQVLRDLLTFARRSEGERALVDVSDLVERTLRLRLYELESRGIACESQLTPQLPPVLGDARQLQQVVLNLVMNAIQAMGQQGAGRLTLRTALAGERVVLEVSDTGPGIPADVRERIFEPFYTTKQDGTGLGLSVSYGIIVAHGGSIDVNSSGNGTTFRITLPVCSPAEAAAAEAERPVFVERSRLQGVRLLFVDDEPSLRSGVNAFGRLRRMSVVTAADGASALEASRLGEFDVVVCDLRMPGMDGPAFYQALQAEKPELAARTIFVTGDMVGASSRAFLESVGQPVLTKPFDFDALEDTVAQVLGGRAQTATTS